MVNFQVEYQESESESEEDISNLFLALNSNT